MSNANNFKRESPPFNIKWVTLINIEASKLCSVVKRREAAVTQKKRRGETRDVIENFLYSLALGMSTNLSFPFPVTTCRVSAGGVRTLIALHYGRKTKIESFASCRGRVNVSGSSKIAWINVECNEDSLSVAVPSKVQKCFQACATHVIPPWQIPF